MIRTLLCLVLSLTLAVTPAFAQLSNIDLPQMGEPADNSMSPAQELVLGKQVMSELYRNDYIVEDPELEDYINSIGWKLAAHSATPPPPLTFFMVADDRINAFALPGGFIGFNAGTLLAAGNESEIAGVLGHEMAHVTQRHIARAEEDTKVSNIVTWAAVLAAILAGSVANPDLVIGAIGAGQAINQQRQVNYTRAHEQEADRIGIQTMAASGFDPNGMASFFGRLEQQTRLYGSRVPELLLTHPLNTTRIAEARARAAAMPKVSYKDSPEFSILQARTRVLAADLPSDAVTYFGGELAAGHDTPANHYGYAMALSALGRNDEALTTLKPALEMLPRQANLNLLKGRIEQGLHQQDLALATFSHTLGLYPHYTPAIFAYADALITAGKTEEARQLLISREQALGTRMETYNLLSQAARESGNYAEAAYQAACYQFLRGDAGNAMAQVDAGLRLANLSTQDRARLIAKRQEIRNSLPANWRAPDGNGRLTALRGTG
ncbi:MAG: M48 family peptidase [Nevskiaceae bacterium]|nr:MAG: M48 family peptidase [Nevskiaceae bacterium]